MNNRDGIKKLTYILHVCLFKGGGGGGDSVGS